MLMVCSLSVLWWSGATEPKTMPFQKPLKAFPPGENDAFPGRETISGAFGMTQRVFVLAVSEVKNA
jgi:hypothetical protein